MSTPEERKMARDLLEFETWVRKFKATWEEKIDWDWAEMDIPVEIKQFVTDLFERLL